MAASYFSTLFCFVLALSLFSNGFSSVISKEKVKVNVYYETLNPNCTHFIANNLPEILQKEFPSIVDLRLVPYGRARMLKGKITCENGGNECFLNEVESCAIYATGSFLALPFISCIEEKIIANKMMEWKSCFLEQGFNQDPVADCFFGPKVKEIQLRHAEETKLAKIELLPWVVVNGKPLGENYLKFIDEICKANGGSCSAKAPSKTHV